MNLNLRIKEIDSHLTEIRKETERVDLTILKRKWIHLLS